MFDSVLVQAFLLSASSLTLIIFNLRLLFISLVLRIDGPAPCWSSVDLGLCFSFSTCNSLAAFEWTCLYCFCCLRRPLYRRQMMQRKLNLYYIVLHCIITSSNARQCSHYGGN